MGTIQGRSPKALMTDMFGDHSERSTTSWTSSASKVRESLSRTGYSGEVGCRSAAQRRRDAMSCGHRLEAGKPHNLSPLVPIRRRAGISGL